MLFWPSLKAHNHVPHDVHWCVFSPLTAVKPRWKVYLWRRHTLDVSRWQNSMGFRISMSPPPDGVFVCMPRIVGWTERTYRLYTRDRTTLQLPWISQINSIIVFLFQSVHLGHKQAQFAHSYNVATYGTEHSMVVWEKGNYVYRWHIWYVWSVLRILSGTHVSGEKVVGINGQSSLSMRSFEIRNWIELIYLHLSDSVWHEWHFASFLSVAKTQNLVA